MITPRPKHGPLNWVSVVLGWFLVASAAQGINVTISETTASPGGEACVGVLLDTDGAAVFGISTDVTFPVEDLAIDAAANCSRSSQAESLGLELACSNRGGNEIRCGVYHLSLIELPDGELARCCFSVLPQASIGEHSLSHNCEAVDQKGESLGATCVAGSVSVQLPTPTPLATTTDTRSPLATNTPTVVGTETPVPVATETPRALCAGDCDGDGQVTINELVRGVGIALGRSSIEACPAFDLNGDDAVMINELVTAVNRALRGCI